MRQKKFGSILVLLCCIPLFCGYLVSQYLFTKNLQADFSKLTGAEMELFRLETENHLRTHMTMLKTLAHTEAIQNFDHKAAKKLLAEFKKGYPDIDVVLSDSQGNQIIRGDNAFLTKIRSFNFYKEAIDGKEEVFSECLISQRNGQALVVLAVPVRTANGTVIGVLQGNLYLDILKTFVTNRSENGMTAYIADREGKIIAHPTEPVIPMQRRDLSTQSFMQKARAGESGVAQISSSKMVNYNYEPKTGWILCIEKSYDEYNSKIAELSILYGIILVFTIVAIIIACIFCFPRINEINEGA